MSAYIKDPAAVLDYRMDWSEWLDDGEDIASSDWTIPDGLTATAYEATTSETVVWLSGGSLGQDYTVTNQVVTDAGRTDERSITISIRHR